MKLSIDCQFHNGPKADAMHGNPYTRKIKPTSSGNTNLSRRDDFG